MVSSREIDGVSYTITPLGTTEGVKMLARIQRVIGAAAKDPDNFIAGVLGALSEADTLYLCNTFMALTQIELEPGSGKVIVLKSVYEEHFSGKFGSLIKWLRFCLETNFGSIFLLFKEWTKEAEHAASLAGKSGAASKPV